ncbi:MAG: PKD domain-containing protein [Acidobacteriota bacterium]|nr:PKD domain-containing protein [Acidobacteriota bacterium]
MAGSPVSFAATSTATGCSSGVNYEWNFGDGTPLTSGASVNHSFTAPGIYNWQLTARADNGTAAIETIAGGYGEGTSIKQSPLTVPIAIARDPMGRGFYVFDQTEATGLLRFINTSLAPVTLLGKTIASGTSRVLLDGRTSIGSINAMEARADGNVLFVAGDVLHALNVSSIPQTVFGYSLAPGEELFLSGSFQQLRNLVGIAIHQPTGEIYVSTPSFVHKVTGFDQSVIVAGNGALTKSTDAFPNTPTPAVNVPLLALRDLAFDAAGNLFICDSGHARVVKLNGGGLLSLAAQFSLLPFNQYPAGLASINDSVYVANGNDQTIWRLTGAGVTSPVLISGASGVGCIYNGDNCGDGGIIAGLRFGMARLSAPNTFVGLESDANGLFVLDQGNEKRGRVRYLNVSAQPVTLAGTVIASNTGDTIGGIGLNLPYDGILATASALTDLSGVTIDANGNLWIADTYRHSIRFVNRGSGIVTLFAGTAAEQTVLPGRIATINRNVPPNAADNVTANKASFNTPQGLFANAQGVFVIDSKGGSIPTGNSSPKQRGGLLRFINTSAATVTFFNGSATPISVAPGFIRTIAGGGTNSDIGNGGFALNARFVAPTDLVVNPTTGDIFITDAGNKAVRKINGSTGVVSSLSLASSFYAGVGMDASGRLYLADFGPSVQTDAGRVLRETVAGSGVFAQMNSSLVLSPRDVVVDSAGNAYVTQSNSRGFPNNLKRIVKIAPDGTVMIVAGVGFGFEGDDGSATNARLALTPPDIYSQSIPVPFPSTATANIVLGANDEIIFADSLNRRVRRIGSVPTTCTKSGTIIVTGNYPQPVISQLFPNTTFVSQPVVMTLSGSGFTPASVVRLGANSLTTNFVSSSQLSAQIPVEFLTAVGVFSISVINPSPGGGISNSLPLAISGDMTPSLSELIPDQVMRGNPGFRLEISGSNFQPSSIVRFNNQNRSTIFVNSTTLQVDVMASEIQLAGSIPVSVFTPSTGIEITNVLPLQIVCRPSVVVPTDLPPARLGEPYNQTLTAVGLNQPVFETGPVAPGLTISSLGVISGIPTTTGTFTFVARVTGEFNCQAERLYRLVVACPQTQLSPTSPILPQATIGTLYSQSFVLNGTTVPTTFAVTSGALPPGLMLLNNGILTGTPTTLGQFNFGIRALTVGGCGSESQYSLTVVCSPINLNITNPFYAVRNVTINNDIQINGGVAPYQFSLIGADTSWLIVTTPLSGPSSIVGTPPTVGVFNFTLRAIDAIGCSAEKPFTIIVEELKTRLIPPPTCIGEGAVVTVELSIPGVSTLPLSTIDLSSDPKPNLIPLPNSCIASTGNCRIDRDSNTVQWNGTPIPSQRATVRYQAQVVNGIFPNVQMCVESFAKYIFFFPGPGNENFSTACTTAICPPPGPGNSLSASVSPDDQRAGSVLVYNIYTSGSTSGNAQNTRLSLTNTHTQQSTNVHLFFVDGASCSVADSYVCLTPNQTASFLAADFDPGTTGYLVAIAVDPNGCPINFNYLIGDEYVKFASGHTANLGAQAFSALAGGLSGCDGNSVTASLNFDGISYSRLPRALALSNIGSRADGNDTMLVVNRISGNLGTGANTLGTLFGIFYNDAENALSFSITGGCQFRASLTNNLPRITPRFEQFVPAGRTGWLRLYSQSPTDIGITGAAINFNPNSATSAGAFNQGHNLHALTLSATNSFTIPVFPPNC